MLDYRIETFLILYEEMNYRRTAERLRMTQPGVTQHIQHLEKHYGVRLFIYDGKKLSRTEYAEALKRHIDSVIAKERVLMEALDKPKRMHLDVGATKTIGEYVLNDALHTYVQQSDDTINFVIDNTETLLMMLERGELDFAVIEGVFDKEKYPHHLFKKEGFVGVCAPDHPFAGKTVPLSRVFEETIMLREPGSGTRRLLEQAISNLGYSMESFRRCISVSNFSVISELVAKGAAITFAYAPVAEKRKDLCVFTAEDMHITGEFNFVYCDEALAREKIRRFFGEQAGALLP